MSFRAVYHLLLLTNLAGCAAQPTTAPDARSPSHDYPPPPRTTANGEALGADGKPITETAGQPAQPPKPEPGK